MGDGEIKIGNVDSGVFRCLSTQIYRRTTTVCILSVSEIILSKLMFYYPLKICVKSSTPTVQGYHIVYSLTRSYASIKTGKRQTGCNR